MPISDTVLQTEGLNLEISTDSGTTWRRVPGVMDFTESGGEAPTRDIVPMSGGVSKRRGRARIPEITFQAFAIPLHSTWVDLRALKVSGGTALFRWSTKEDTLFAAPSGTTAAIAVTGVVTFAGAAAASAYPAALGYGPGAVIKIGSHGFRIDSANDAAGTPPNQVVVKPAPTQAVAAASFSILIGAVRRGQFSAQVSDVDQIEAGSESELRNALTIIPIAELPALELVI